MIDNGFAADVLEALSLTVTLKLKGLPTSVVGVPLMVPLEEFSVRPGGSAPELTNQLL